MSLPAREPPPSADASLTLRFDDSDRDVLARAFRTPGEGPSAWRLNREAHRISLVDGFDRLLAWRSFRESRGTITRSERPSGACATCGGGPSAPFAPASAGRSRGARGS